MALVDLLRKPVVAIVLERPGRKRSLTEWAQTLEKDGEAILQRVAAKDSAQARATLRHVTGIERWGQRRLRVALGEPFVHDEFDDYQPPAEADWATLCEAFRTTRHTTVALVDHVAATKAADEIQILHNQLGPLRVRGWLRYLDLHANLESRRIR
ncbi:MAG: hypothetical protein KF832_23550 [Caldilineaceae bacterium]|nr:hypothetical protein [Caldilineaceae bacterium]